MFSDLVRQLQNFNRVWEMIAIVLLNNYAAKTKKNVKIPSNFELNKQNGIKLT